MRAKKTKRFSLVVKHTLEREIVIDFIIIDWLGVCPVFFLFFFLSGKKCFPHNSLYFYVWLIFWLSNFGDEFFGNRWKLVIDFLNSQ